MLRKIEVMKAKTRIIAASFWVLASASACAQSWSLDSCVAYAVEHNISVRQGNLQIMEGKLAINEARDGYLPTVDASANQSFSFGRGLTAANTYDNKNIANTQWSLALNLPIFQGLSGYKKQKVAELSLQKYLYENEATKDDITLNVIAQYLQVLYCREVEKSAMSQSEYSEFEVTRQKALVEAGKVAEASLYDAEALAAQDRLAVVTARNDTRTSLVNLANLLQLKSIDGFDISSIDETEPFIPGPDVVYSAAMGINNSVLGARQGIRVADESIALAKTGYIPKLSFSGGIGSSYYSVSGTPSENFGAQMRHNFAPYIGLNLYIPLFDAFSTRNAIRRAKVQKLNAELTLEQRSTDLYKQIQLAYYQAVGARERYLTSEETLEKTRKSFEAVSERFNLGRVSQADYEQSKNNLFKTEISRIQAHFEYLLRSKILRFYQSGGLK